MKKQLIALLTCVLSLNLYSRDNDALGQAVEKADLTAFKNLFASRQASVNDTYGFDNDSILNVAIEAYTSNQTLANQNIEEMIKFLLKNGAHINQPKKHMLMPLHQVTNSLLTAKFRNIGKEKKLEDIVALLLKYNANVNAQDAWGRTPLHYATFNAELYSPKIVKLLLENNADPDIKDKNGLTPQAQFSLDDRENAISEKTEIKKTFNAYSKTGLAKVLNAEKEKPYKSFKDLGVKFE